MCLQKYMQQMKAPSHSNSGKKLMELPPNRAFTIPVFLLFLLFFATRCEDERVILSLVNFMDSLSGGKAAEWGWTNSSDPCTDNWMGVRCNSRGQLVRRIVLDDQNLTGSLDAASLCAADSLAVLSLNHNSISGQLSEEIANCSQLSHIYLSRNRLSGHLPHSVSGLNNLKTLDISGNNFSGQLPDLAPISGLSAFLAHNNGLTGRIPDFDFENLKRFNVSNNNFTGPIPDVGGKFSADSFLGNPALCGAPLQNACPPPSPLPAPPPSTPKKKESSTNNWLIISGYVVLLLVIAVLLVKLLLVCRRKPEQQRQEADASRKALEQDSPTIRPTSGSSEFRTGKSRSEYSLTSAESGSGSTPLVILTSLTVKDLRFEDLLRAPAELLGRGKHGSLYRVMLDSGVTLAVKRVKGWSISSEGFKVRMQRMDQVRHPNVLSAIAFYSSKQERLLVFEYQQNGSLFGLLRASQNGQEFNWGARLNTAASIAKALAYMHEELGRDEIAHGNLKSTNILFDKNMEPCLSEYGLMLVDNEEQAALPRSDGFKADLYGFGVILLELLTGKVVQNNGLELARWVHSVVKEEWTVQVFDELLISEGASEERMMSLLQVALKCINPIPKERPNIRQTALMIKTIKGEEDRSPSSE